MDVGVDSPSFSSGGNKLASDRENRAYSVRLSASDLRKLKTIAERLKVTESELIRFALRKTLNRLAPLDDEHTKGASLLPVFVEFGDELTSYFDLDVSRLEAIFAVDEEGGGRPVDREDIGLLVMAGLEDTRLYARLRELTDRNVDIRALPDEFRNYLYEKYLYSDSA